MYHLPRFLEGVLTRDDYVRWLQGKAQSHVVRDRRRWGDDSLSNSGYKQAIHQAVLDSKGRDYYTGEELDWSLLRRGAYDSKIRYDPEARRGFRLRPAVDHISAEPADEPDFVICADRTNRCKSDLSVGEMRKFCDLFLKGTMAALLLTTAGCSNGDTPLAPEGTDIEDSYTIVDLTSLAAPDSDEVVENPKGTLHRGVMDVIFGKTRHRTLCNVTFHPDGVLVVEDRITATNNLGCDDFATPAGTYVQEGDRLTMITTREGWKGYEMVWQRDR